MNMEHGNIVKLEFVLLMVDGRKSSYFCDFNLTHHPGRQSLEM